MMRAGRQVHVRDVFVRQRGTEGRPLAHRAGPVGGLQERPLHCQLHQWAALLAGAAPEPSGKPLTSNSSSTAPASVSLAFESGA